MTVLASQLQICDWCERCLVLLVWHVISSLAVPLYLYTTSSSSVFYFPHHCLILTHKLYNGALFYCYMCVMLTNHSSPQFLFPVVLITPPCKGLIGFFRFAFFKLVVFFAYVSFFSNKIYLKRVKLHRRRLCVGGAMVQSVCRHGKNLGLSLTFDPQSFSPVIRFFHSPIEPRRQHLCRVVKPEADLEGCGWCKRTTKF